MPQTVTPFTTLPKPTISSLVTSANGGVTLSVSGIPNTQTFTLEASVGGGGYTVVQSFTGTGSFTLSSPVAAPACFRAVVKDACNNQQPSDEVCSIGLDVTAGNLVNTVRWTSEGKGVPRYTVLRDNTPVTTVNAGQPMTYTDNQNLACGTAYAYQLRALANNGVTTIESEIKKVTANSTEVPPPYRKVIVSVNADGRVDLQGLLDASVNNKPNYKMLVYRQDSPGGPFRQVAEEVSRSSHQVMGLNVNSQSYCFQVAYQNSCGITSTLSAPACTIWLKSDSPNSVDWTPESPFVGETVARYRLEKLDESGAVVEEKDLQANTSFRPNLTDPDIQRFRFRVVAYSSDNSISYSNYRTFTAQPLLFVPDAFTPNGDQINDAFVVKGSSFFRTVTLTVFSRWGEALFSSDKAEGWDGSLNGQPAPPGTYIYRVEAVDQLGQTTVRRGTVVLIR
ncbi:T9SS type B sorting domain-containing protein [Tellurirhabdus rosea]|uniref:T9SS type B sorting domain-containing protein n=1 Tax=Tellurirhabdus rosea TaxID=2674997 RepID=UPI00224F8EDE|nr:gliding motility-associated C-terminal domain-containing protein [Tellurirhabdus rosea]